MNTLLIGAATCTLWLAPIKAHIYDVTYSQCQKSRLIILGLTQLSNTRNEASQYKLL